MSQCIYGCNLIQKQTRDFFFKLKKVRKNIIFRHFYHLSPPAPQRDFSECLRAYYVRRGAGYKIHICAKLYYLGRAKVSSSVATDFGPSTNMERRKYDYYRVAFPEKVPVTLDKAYIFVSKPHKSREFMR